MQLECKHKGCYMNGTEVDVDEDTPCLGCGNKLKPKVDLGDLFGGLFGDRYTSPFSGVFG